LRTVDEKGFFCYSIDYNGFRYGIKEFEMVVTNGKKVLELSGLEAVYASAEHLLRYLNGFEAENGCSITDKTGTTFYTDRRYIEAAEKFFAGSDVTPKLYTQKEVLERLASYKSVGISFNWTSHREYLALEKAGAKLENIDEALACATSTKNEWEIGRIQAACEIAERRFWRLCRRLKRV
jgi:Xaa-Pro aminopeptidase